MNIGVVGNRTGWIYKEIKEKLDTLGMYHSDVIITGGANGVDEFARMYAEEHGNECLILYPKPSLPSPNRFFQRNREIACRCDILVAFNNKPRSGTSNTIRYARELNKQVIVVGTDENEKST